MNCSLKRILVVDDEDMILDVLSTLLQEDGYDVITSKHGGLAIIQADAVDLIILDLSLSEKDDMEGGTVLSRLWKDEAYSIPIIIYSAHVSSNSENNFLDEIERVWGKGRKIYKCVEKGAGVKKLLDAVHDYFRTEPVAPPHVLMSMP
jgi:CheY-like chemotaxis protein